MRLPNGYGSVYKMSGARRNPWAVRITTGWEIDPETQKTKQKYKFVGYYATRKEALAALADYNQSPYDVDASKITLGEVYEKWSAEFYPQTSKRNSDGLKYSWTLCVKDGIDKEKISNITLDRLQRLFDSSDKNFPTLRKVKILLNAVYKYAVIHDYIPQDKNRISYIKIKAGNPNKIDRNIFTRAEIEKIWEISPSNRYYTVVLILIYTGLRINELLSLKKEDVNLQSHTFKIVSSKTAAGVRTVPIADKIYPFFCDWMDHSPADLLICNEHGQKMTYDNFIRAFFRPLIKDAKMGEHHIHDTRHTCISMLAAAGVDERIIKKIVGHKGQGVTEAVYTHFDYMELLDAINKI